MILQNFYMTIST